MAKKANGEGSVRRRSNGTWEARFVIGEQRKSVYGATQAEVVRKKREALTAAEEGRYVDPSRVTVSQWLTTWELTYGRPTWRATTASTHHQTIVNHLLPTFGAILLQKLCADDIQRFVNTQLKDGVKPATVVKHLSPLKSAIKQAVLLKKRVGNPFDGVRLPKITQEEIVFLTEEEQRRYVAVLPCSTYGRMLRFLLGTGLRVGEAMALRWSDVSEDCFTVRQTIATVSNLDADEAEGKTRQQLNAPKTTAGNRVIPLCLEMRLLLDRQRKAQVVERLKAGSAWGQLPDGMELSHSDAFVFASAVGTPLQLRNVRRAHNLALQASGVSRVTLHGLRHSFATRWVANDSDIRGLSEILGHEDVATTLRKYVHSDPRHKANMMQRMGVI